ncbi:hypothetical protein [Defluviitalea phaphyphila]|uniref:hypothetical protein n=1 Tax=Defluviitalea phaphyphila TaxID=1473580 RepID=UPI0007318EA5|nr:hypothetical protein [Defluviitalea phaphyphila]
MHNNFEQLKEKYKEGYRCIKTENDEDVMKIYLKNFYTEKIDTLICNNKEEINLINNYINSIKENKY